MIGSQGIHDLSRAAGDEQLRNIQRIDRDSHKDKERGGGNRDSDRDKEKDKTTFEDSYDSAIHKQSSPVDDAPEKQSQHATRKSLDVSSVEHGRDESGKSSGSGDNTDPQAPERRPSGPERGKHVKTDDIEHIDLIG